MTIVAENGRTLRVSQVVAGDDHGWTYSVDLELESAKGGVGVYDYGTPQLPVFFSALAADWRGFEEAREFVTLEGDFSIRATHDGKGTVTCLIRVRQPWPPTWDMEAEFDLGAGAHLERIGSDLTALFAAAESRRTAEH